MIDFEIPNDLLVLLEEKNSTSKPIEIKQKSYPEKKYNLKIQKNKTPKASSKTLVEFSESYLGKEEKEKEEPEDSFYPLIRNYPNGSDDYYLRLESKKIRNKVKVLFVKKNIFDNKIFNTLKAENLIDEKNYELIITKKSEILNPNNTPVIFVNCEPKGFINKNKMFYFYDKINLYKKNKYFLQTNNIKHMYRKNSSELVEFICKLKKEGSL